MAVSTNNAYGKISISDLAIARVTAHTAAESYGIVEVSSPDRRAPKGVSKLVKNEKWGRAVKVTIINNRIHVDVSVVVKYGVSIDAVADSLKEAVKYKVEAFTGMIVNTVNVNVVGVKL